MPMKCPFCGEEMTPGVIQSRDGVYWSREAGAVAALAVLKKDAHCYEDTENYQLSIFTAFLIILH